jgi:anaerobic selenocysteine-containing dehydrogenase
MPSPTRRAYRTCPLCEAGCGLEIELEAGSDGTEVVRRIRGDRDDVFSAGFLCPKGPTLDALHRDPDRLRQPLVRRDGRHVEVGWDEAFAEVARRWGAVVAAHGRPATAVYLGNPTSHNLDALTYVKVLLGALATPHVYSVATVDQRPKELASGLLFGQAGTIAVPDVDRTDLIVLLGANPLTSNGSLATAPDWPGRLAAVQARGGRVVVVDPRRSETARRADRHLAIVPGTDAALLAALCQVLFAEGRADVGHLKGLVSGEDEVRRATAAFTPTAVAPFCGLPAAAIVELARDLATAPRAVVYGRVGTCTQAYGTTASWLVDVVNTLTGNLDRPGGAMFTTPATGSPNLRGRPRYGRGMILSKRRSRVRGLPVTLGETPVCTLAEEITTPGERQLRALLTVAGNPVLSVPNGGGALDRALATLDVLVAVDLYLNETTRHADVILPVPSPLQKPHYDLSLLPLAVRNVANYSPPVLPLDDGEPAEWEVLARLALIAAAADGTDPGADPARVAALDDEQAAKAVRNAADAEALLAAVAHRRGPARLLDLMLRRGPYALTLDELEAAPHGIDLGPLVPRLPDALRTASGTVELAPAPLVDDLARLDADVRAATTPTVPTTPGGAGSPGGPSRLLLVGRRELRSNNSWMHNLDVLVRGPERCTLHLHPADAERLGLAAGGLALVRSRTGAVTTVVELTTDVRPGVVSLPHGWGHDRAGTRLGVASTRPGVNSNLLADEARFDPLSGTAVLNGIPVEVSPAPGGRPV